MKREDIFGCQEAAELLSINRVRVHQLVKSGVLTAEEWGCEKGTGEDEWKPINELIDKKIARKKLRLDISQVVDFWIKHNDYKKGEEQKKRLNTYMREYMRRKRNNEPTHKKDWE